MSVFRLDPEVYRRWRDEVFRLSNSFQRIGQRGLSDREIAERLGLDERTVIEIRCVAERDAYPLEEWERAIEFKRRACLEWAALALRRPDLRPGGGDADPGPAADAPPRPDPGKSGGAGSDARDRG
jgi:hypothetical protein